MADRHLSEEELARLQDGELPAAEGSHLEGCAECAGRLRELQTAAAAYGEYRASVLSDNPPPAPWRRLGSLISEAEERRVWWPRRWAFAGLAAALSVAIVCVAIGGRVVLRRPPVQSWSEASDLLTRSSRTEPVPSRAISMRFRGRSVIRPAVLMSAEYEERDPDVSHLRNMFIAARYSWREPLNARSFESWRQGLREKRDTVSVIRDSGDAPAYRVRTDTGDGRLRSAALTLRGSELRPVNGAFEFEGEPTLEMNEISGPVPNTQGQRMADTKATAETPASPADTLHVLAALNAIGADVGEPVDVTRDSHGIVVRAAGLGAERRRQIAEALAPLPRVRVELEAVPPDGFAPSHAGTSERFSSSVPGPLRKQFEVRLGGAATLQVMTDRVLEASALVVARAHALDFLASRFPPPVEAALGAEDRELLRKLRQRHVAELRSLMGQIRTELQPLLPAPSAGGSAVSGLIDVAQAFDEALNQVLAGNYAQSSGESTLRALADQLDGLERSVRREELR